MNQVKILYTYTSNEGEEFDDEENFVGYKKNTVLKEKIVAYDEVLKALEDLANIAADYGDGITNANVIAIVDAGTNEVLPLDYRYYKRD
jgi:hypothetical protein